MADSIRTFVAFDLPDDIIDHVAGLQAKLQAYGLKLRWVRPRNLHLTLRPWQWARPSSRRAGEPHLCS